MLSKPYSIRVRLLIRAVHSIAAVNAHVYAGVAALLLALHLLFIGWVIFGAFLTRSRPVLRTLHIASLFWGILIEVLPWTCPLTYIENWAEQRAGVEPYQGGFLLHYLDRLVYPSVSLALLTTAGVVVCVANLSFYARQAWLTHRSRASA
jgi:hypothetical protein